MNVEDRGYLAGLLEGEGCICARPGGAVILQLQMTDREPVERVARIVGHGVVREYKKRGCRKTVYGWTVGSREILKVVFDEIYPLMSQRRKDKIDSVRELVNRPPYRGIRTHHLAHPQEIESCPKCRSRRATREYRRRKGAVPNLALAAERGWMA